MKQVFIFFTLIFIVAAGWITGKLIAVWLQDSGVAIEGRRQEPAA